jgi:hypothetical protein
VLQEQVRKLAAQRVLGELLQQRKLAPLREQLHLAEAQVRARHARADCPRLLQHPLARPLVVGVPLAYDTVARHHDAEAARCGHAQRGHRLRREELAHARAQHGAPVELPGVRGGARALELQLELTGLAERDGAPVAALASVLAGKAGAVRGGPALVPSGR